MAFTLCAMPRAVLELTIDTSIAESSCVARHLGKDVLDMLRLGAAYGLGAARSSALDAFGQDQ